MKQFIKDNWFKIAIILVALFAIMLFYVFKYDEAYQIEGYKERQAYKLNLCLSVSESTTERADCFKQFPQ